MADIIEKAQYSGACNKIDNAEQAAKALLEPTRLDLCSHFATLEGVELAEIRSTLDKQLPARLRESLYQKCGGMTMAPHGKSQLTATHNTLSWMSELFSDL